MRVGSKPKAQRFLLTVTRMLSGAEIAAVETWLARFEHALRGRDGDALEALFVRDSFWRDVLAFSWRIETVSGAHAVTRELLADAERVQPSGFAIDPNRAPPRRVTRAGTDSIEAIFRFETAQAAAAAACCGSRTPRADRSRPGRFRRCWKKSRDLKNGPVASAGQVYSRDFRGPTGSTSGRVRRVCRSRSRRPRGRRRSGRVTAPPGSANCRSTPHRRS